MSPDQELDRFLNRRTVLFYRAMVNVVRSKFGQADRNTAVTELADLIGRTMILADLHGRKRVLMEVDHSVTNRGNFASTTPIVPSIPFFDAIEDLLSREPRLARSAEEVARLYSREHVFAMARAAEGHVEDRIAKWRTEQVQRRLVEGVTVGRGLAEFSEAMKEIGPWTQAYADTVYRTNVSNAYTQGRFAEANDPEVMDIMPALEIIGIEDDRERPNHAAARGMIAATNDPIWNRIRPPLGYQCFLPGTLVEGAVISASKLAYSGPAVEIKTRLGASISVTINHPVLTLCGWRSADILKEGDYLLCDARKIESFNELVVGGNPSDGRAVDDQNMPSAIEDVYEALASKGIRLSGSRPPVLPLDFHGDARWSDGDIDVVWSDWKFLLDSSEDEAQRFGKLPFVNSPVSATSRQGIGNFGFGGERFSDTSCGSPGGSALAMDDCGIISAFSSETPFHLFRVGSSSCWDVVASEEAKNSSVIDPVLISQLHRASSGDIVADQVVSVRRFPFVGNVYNLQTVGGWILSNNIVTSNCRHGVRMVSRFELERRGLLDKGGRVIRYEPPGFVNAGPDEGFRPGV